MIKFLSNFGKCFQRLFFSGGDFFGKDSKKEKLQLKTDVRKLFNDLWGKIFDFRLPEQHSCRAIVLLLLLLALS